MPRLHNERLAKDVEGFECGPCAGTGASLAASPTATSGTAAVAPAAPAAPVAAEGVSERRVWQIH